VTVFWNQGLHAGREVTANRPDIIIKNKKRENMHTDGCGNTIRQTCHAKGSRIETKMQEFMYRDITNVEHEMYDYNGNNWSHRNSNKRFKEKFGNHARKTFNRFTTKTALLGTSHVICKVLQSETWKSER
jgi:hypothetical protein